MFIFRTNLIPSLLHKAVLGRVSRGTLVYMDRVSRAAVRGWLRLPRDTPVPFFHADSRDGGLAVRILRYIIPIVRRKRKSRMFTSEDSVVRSVTELPVYQRHWRNNPKCHGKWSLPVCRRDGSSRMQRFRLCESVGHGWLSLLDKT